MMMRMDEPRPLTLGLLSGWGALPLAGNWGPTNVSHPSGEHQALKLQTQTPLAAEGSNCQSGLAKLAVPGRLASDVASLA